MPCFEAVNLFKAHTNKAHYLAVLALALAQWQLPRVSRRSSEQLQTELQELQADPGKLDTTRSERGQVGHAQDPVVNCNRLWASCAPCAPDSTLTTFARARPDAGV